MVKGDLGFFSYTDKGGVSTKDEGNSGKIANALSKAIAYDRSPELFDSEEIKDRDNELKALAELKNIDTKLCIDRKDKPVLLSSFQARIVHALSWAISRDGGEDVKKKSLNPFRGGNQVARTLNITSLTALLNNGSTRAREKEKVIKELFNLSRIRQVQILGNGDNKVKITAPLINIGTTIEDLSPEKINNLDQIEVIFGGAFFVDLDKRFATITPKLFEVWGKKGRGTELYATLQSSIFAVYWHYRQAANKAEERVRADKDNKKLSKEELHDLIRNARRKAMTYELNFTSIKRRVTTDYDSQKQYRAKFKKDLENAIEGFKELGLISEAYISSGAKGQDKVVFILDEAYNFVEKENTPALLEADNGQADNEPSAF